MSHLRKTGFCPQTPKCHSTQNGQEPQYLQTAFGGSHDVSGLASTCHDEAERNEHQHELLNTLRKHRHERAVERYRQMFPTKLAFAEYELGCQIQQSLTNYPSASLSIFHKSWILVHRAVAKLAHRQALHALHQAYQTQKEVSAHLAWEKVGWYKKFCYFSYRLFPKIYRYSYLIKPQRQNQ